MEMLNPTAHDEEISTAHNIMYSDITVHLNVDHSKQMISISIAIVTCKWL